MTDSALLALAVAAGFGVLAGRAWASAERRRRGDRPTSRTPHYTLGLHYLASGRVELALSELHKAAREARDAVEVLLVLGTLLREAGQVERAIQVHQKLLGRTDLTRSERIHVLASLGTDFRKAGFLDRAGAAFAEVLALDPKNIHALGEVQKLHEEQREWRQAYDVRTRLARLRKADDGLVLGHIQAEIGREALAAGEVEAAEEAFRTALALDRRVFPAHLGLAEIHGRADPRRAVAVLEEAVRTQPERAYLAFEPLARAYAQDGAPSRIVAVCEEIVGRDPRDWRARLVLARHLAQAGGHQEALGLLLRAVEANPQVLAVHLAVWRTLRHLGLAGDAAALYLETAEGSIFYRDPHLCTVCRYRADDMLWRCPHCHEWGTFVEERVAPPSGSH